MRLFLLGAAVLLAGCPDPETRSCSGFVGDPDKDIEIELIVRRADRTSFVPQEGDVVDLLKPPQGGKMIFAGVRARNLDTCAVKLTSSLRDTCTNRLLGIEGRPVNLTVGSDGWAGPTDPMEIQNYGNLASCPSAAAVRDIEGEPYLLRVAIEDQGGRKAERKLVVTPRCAEPDVFNECRCECSGDYVLGERCLPEPDGGPPPGQCAPDGGMP